VKEEVEHEEEGSVREGFLNVKDEAVHRVLEELLRCVKIEEEGQGPSGTRKGSEREELVSLDSSQPGTATTHRPNKVAQQEASSRPRPRRSPLGALLHLLAEREGEDVQGDGYPNQGYHIPGGAGEHFEVGWTEETGGMGEVTVRRREG
jgi:hypothetical protein